MIQEYFVQPEDHREAETRSNFDSGVESDIDDDWMEGIIQNNSFLFDLILTELHKITMNCFVAANDSMMCGTGLSELSKTLNTNEQKEVKSEYVDSYEKNGSNCNSEHEELETTSMDKTSTVTTNPMTDNNVEKEGEQVNEEKVLQVESEEEEEELSALVDTKA